MLKGAVDSYNSAHGFGYIKVEHGERVFFHISGLLDSTHTLKEGTKVNFVVAEGARGPQAVKITFDDNPL